MRRRHSGLHAIHFRVQRTEAHGLGETRDGAVIRLSSAQFQPIASADVAAALADLVVGPPLNRTVEVGGPERIGFDALARRFLATSGDKRRVIGDADALYFGTRLDDSSLTTGDQARIGPTRFEDWLGRAAA